MHAKLGRVARRGEVKVCLRSLKIESIAIGELCAHAKHSVVPANTYARTTSVLGYLGRKALPSNRAKPHAPCWRAREA